MYIYNFIKGLEIVTETGFVKLASEPSMEVASGFFQSSISPEHPERAQAKQEAGSARLRSRLGSWCSSSRSTFPYMGKLCSNF